MEKFFKSNNSKQTKAKKNKNTYKIVSIAAQKLEADYIWNNVSKLELFYGLKNHYKYLIKKKIGQGAYSKVYYAEQIYSDEVPYTKKIACKVIDRRKLSNRFCQRFLPRELNIIKSIQHPNIIRILGIYELGPFASICMEYCAFGDLLNHIQINGPVPEDRSKKYFFQLANAVKYLHDRNIAHRDIKCENILLITFETIKLSDFGFSKRIKKIMGIDCLSRTYCGSTSYAPPEVIRGIPYDAKMFDVWAMGCVLFVMMYGIMLYDETNIMETLKQQELHFICFPQDVKNVELENLISEMLQPNVKKRFNIGEILDHSWIANAHSHELGEPNTTSTEYLNQ